jgi:hypothetical protein
MTNQHVNHRVINAIAKFEYKHKLWKQQRKDAGEIASRSYTYNVEQTANVLGVHPETINRWRRSGIIPSLQFSDRIFLYRLLDVVRALKIEHFGLRDANIDLTDLGRALIESEQKPQ